MSASFTTSPPTKLDTLQRLSKDHRLSIWKQKPKVSKEHLMAMESCCPAVILLERQGSPMGCGPLP